MGTYKLMSSKESFVLIPKDGTPDRVPIWEYLFNQKLNKIIVGYNTQIYIMVRRKQE